MRKKLLNMILLDRQAEIGFSGPKPAAFNRQLDTEVTEMMAQVYRDNECLKQQVVLTKVSSVS